MMKFLCLLFSIGLMLGDAKAPLKDVLEKELGKSVPLELSLEEQMKRFRKATRDIESVLQPTLPSFIDKSAWISRKEKKEKTIEKRLIQHPVAATKVTAKKSKSETHLHDQSDQKTQVEENIQNVEEKTSEKAIKQSTQNTVTNQKIETTKETEKQIEDEQTVVTKQAVVTKKQTNEVDEVNEVTDEFPQFPGKLTAKLKPHVAKLSKLKSQLLNKIHGNQTKNGARSHNEMYLHLHLFGVFCMFLLVR